MRAIWVGVHPQARETRILAMSGSEDTLLKARLAPRVQHPRALPSLLEALAMWEGTPVRAALVADERGPRSDTNLFHVSFADFGPTPLYSLDVVSRLPPRRRDRLDGLGSFHDLRRMLLSEVAR